MKKVGKEFKKTLSAILVAAMVFTSLPQTTLVAKAAEEDPQQTVYDVGSEFNGAENPDSVTVNEVAFSVTDGSQAVSGVGASAEVVKYNATQQLVFIQGVTLTGDAKDNYEIVSVGGVNEEEIDGVRTYRFSSSSAPNTTTNKINVVVRQKETLATIQLPESVTGKYTVSGSSSYDTASGADYSFTVTPESEYGVEVTAKIGDQSVAVTKGSGNTYTISKNAIKAGDTVTITVAAIYTVTFTGLEDVSATIRYTDDKTKAATNSVDKTEGVKLKAGTYYFLITVPSNNVIESVKVSGNPIKPVLGVSGELYEVNVTDNTAVAVTVANETATISVSKDANTTVYYTTDTTATATEDFIKLTGSSIKVKKNESVLVYVEYAENYELDKVKINGVDAVDGDKQTVDSNKTAYLVKTANDDTPISSPSFQVTSKRSVEQYTFNAISYDGGIAEADQKAKIYIKKDGVSLVETVTTESGPTEKVTPATADIEVTNANVKVQINKGEKLTFKIELPEGYSVNIPNAEKWAGEAYPYVATANTITATVSKIAAPEVSFTSDANVSAITTKVGAGTDTLISSGKATNVEYNKALTFKVTLASGYVIDYVTYQADDADKQVMNDVTPANGVYTYEIPAVTKDVAIDIHTKVDPATLNTFVFNYPDTDLVITTTANVDETDTTLPKSGKEYKLAVNKDADQDITFTVSSTTGYVEKEVKVDGVVLKPTVENGHTYKVTFAKSATKVDKKIEITSKIDESIKVEKDKFISFGTIPADVTVTVPSQNGVEKVTYNNATLYKISSKVEEVEFTVSVPYGKKLTGDTNGKVTITGALQTADRALSSDKKSQVYSYKIVVNQIGAYEEESSAKSFSIPAAVDDTATVNIYDKGTTNPSSNASIDVTKIVNGTKVEADAPYPVGSEALITVDAGYKLQIKGKTDAKTGVTEYKNVTLDAYNTYLFKITEDITFVTSPASEAAKYTVSANKYSAATGTTAAITDTTKVIEVIPGDKITNIAVSNSGTVTLSKVAFTEEVKSTFKIGSPATSAEIVIAAEDAGKTLTANLYTIETNNGEKQEVICGTLTIKVSPVVATVDVKGIKNNATVKLDAATTTKFEVNIKPEAVDENLYALKIESGKTTTANFLKEDGKLYIVVATPAKAETAKISVVEKVTGKENALFTFTAESVLPELKLSKIDSSAQGMNDINLTMTADKSVKDANANGKVYYEVTVEADTTGAPAGTTAKKVYYFAKEANKTELSKKIAVNTEVETKSTSWPYIFTVRMVLLEDTSVDETAKSSALTAVAAGPAIVKTFATRNPYYEDKLAVTKKTTSIYTGQENVVAGIVKFSKNASYITDVTIRVLNKDGVEVTTGITLADSAPTVDSATSEIKLDVAPYVKPDKYTVEISALAKQETVGDTPNVATMYRATAKLPITVVAGINYIDTSAIAKKLVVGSKDVSYTLKPYGYSGYSYLSKAKSQKFKFEVVDAGHTSLANSVAANADVIKKYVSVNEKTGKLVIKKGITLSNNTDNNKFAVKITADDFEGNTCAAVYANIELTKTAMEIGEIYLEKGVQKLSSTCTMSEADGATIKVLDTEGVDITSLVTFTPAAKQKNGVWTSNGFNGTTLHFVKAAKTFSIKATTTDGGKKSKTVKYSIGNDTFKDFKYELTSNQTSFVETGANTYEYKATNNPELTLDVYDGAAPARQTYYNYKVSVKGGKQVDRSANGFKFVPTAKETKITITDQVTKSRKPVVITVTNLTYPTAKAPSAKTTDKLYTDMKDAATGAAIPQTLTFTVAKNTYEAVNVTYESGSLSGLSLAYDNTDPKQSNTVVPLVDNKFTLKTTSLYTTTVQSKYTVTYGHYDGNNFIPDTKSATLTIKVNKLATFKPNTSYTITPSDSKIIKLTGKPANVDVDYSLLQNANVGGKPNRFRDIFTLNEANGTLTLNTAATDYATIVADKKNLTGYVTYTYRKNVNDIIQKTAKITVKISDKELKYTTDAIDVVKGATATTAVTTVKVNKKAVALNPTIVPVTTGWAVTATDADKGIITLSATSAAIGKNIVEFKMLPKDSSFVDVSKDGIVVSAVVNVLDPAASKSKLKIKNANADLEKAAKSYDASSNKTGVYTLVLPVTDVFTPAVQGVVVKSMEAATTAPTGFAASYADGNITLKVNAKDIAAKKSYKFPVTVKFESGADEIITFNVAAPKSIADAASVEAAVRSYLSTFHASASSGGSADETAIKTALNTGSTGVPAVIDPITGITASTVTATYTPATTGTTPTPASYKVTVTLNNPAATTPIEIKDVAILAPLATPIQEDIDDALNAVNAKAALIVSKKSTDPDVAKTQLEVSNATTRFTIRQFLQPEINNSEFMLSITKFEIKPAVDGTAAAPAGKNGYIIVKYKVVSQTVASNEANLGTLDPLDGEYKITILPKEYVAR